MILHPEELDRSSFRKLGDFEDLLTTSDTYSGKKTEEGFFPGCAAAEQQRKGYLRVRHQGLRQKPDYHQLRDPFRLLRGSSSLDGDIYLYAAPPFWYMQLDQTRLFRVPKGTMVKLKPGVIHGAPISVTGDPVNVLILLPERTYSNDCQFTQLEEKDYMQIED